MIDASSFAVHHSAFWADYTPTSEYFVRRLNLEYAERWSTPLDKPKEQIRAALVAELAFSRFCAKLEGTPDTEAMESALKDAVKRLRPLMDDPVTLGAQLSKSEVKQISGLEANLRSFISSRGGKSSARPLFHGCGYLDASEGDILSGSCLFEVKAVDRPFRSADVRQLVTYCALNHASGQFRLENMGVLNPRRGLYFEMPIDEVSREISGRSGQELLDSIVHAVSSGDISR